MYLFISIYFDLDFSWNDSISPLDYKYLPVCVFVFSHHYTLIHLNIVFGTAPGIEQTAYPEGFTERPQSQVNTLITVFLHEMSSQARFTLKTALHMRSTQFTSCHFFILDGRKSGHSNVKSPCGTMTSQLLTPVFWMQPCNLLALSCQHGYLSVTAV